jgi:uncharacterized phage-associated protein
MIEKYTQLILHAIKCGADQDGKITKTKLAKMVYLSDFAHFYSYLDSISGLKYRHIDYGPVADEYFRIIDQLEESGVISIERKDKANLICLNEVNLFNEELTAEEKETIEKVCKKWKHKNTMQIVDFTHKQLPYKLTEPEEIIPYELITQEEVENVY